MRTSAARRAVPGGMAGHSLVELLVVLAIAGLVLAAGLPVLSGGHGAAGLEADARMLAARLRLARETALATRSPTAVGIDLAAAKITGPGTQPPYRLHAVQRLAVTTAKGPVEKGQAVISFAPDGSSSGGVVALAAAGQIRRVHVAWLTGVVRLGPGGP